MEEDRKKDEKAACWNVIRERLIRCIGVDRYACGYIFIMFALDTADLISDFLAVRGNEAVTKDGMGFLMIIGVIGGALVWLIHLYIFISMICFRDLAKEMASAKRKRHIYVACLLPAFLEDSPMVAGTVYILYGYPELVGDGIYLQIIVLKSMLLLSY